METALHRNRHQMAVEQVLEAWRATACMPSHWVLSSIMAEGTSSNRATRCSKTGPSATTSSLYTSRSHSRTIHDTKKNQFSTSTWPQTTTSNKITSPSIPYVIKIQWFLIQRTPPTSRWDSCRILQVKTSFNQIMAKRQMETIMMPQSWCSNGQSQNIATRRSMIIITNWMSLRRLPRIIEGYRFWARSVQHHPSWGTRQEVPAKAEPSRRIPGISRSSKPTRLSQGTIGCMLIRVVGARATSLGSRGGQA